MVKKTTKHDLKAGDKIMIKLPKIPLFECTIFGKDIEGGYDGLFWLASADKDIMKQIEELNEDELYDDNAAFMYMTPVGVKALCKEGRFDNENVGCLEVEKGKGYFFFQEKHIRNSLAAILKDIKKEIYGAPIKKVKKKVTKMSDKAIMPVKMIKHPRRTLVTRSSLLKPSSIGRFIPKPTK